MGPTTSVDSAAGMESSDSLPASGTEWLPDRAFQGQRALVTGGGTGPACTTRGP